MSRPPLVFRPSTEAAPAPEPAPPQTPAPSATPASGDADPVLHTISSARPTTFGLDDPSDGHAPSLDAFAPEHEIRFKTHRPSTTTGPSFLMIAVAATVVVGILGLTYTALRRPRTLASPGAGTPVAGDAAAATGLAQFDSRPSGAEVWIDGTSRGRTPLKLSLPVGAHQLEIRSDAGTRTLPLTIDAGILVSQYVELTASATADSGKLEITSEPAGAQVSVDGTARGVTPLTLDAIDAREHTVSLTRGSNTVLRKVRVTAGATASVFASLGAAAPGAVGGYIALSAPFDVQVLEDGRLLGTNSSERLMVPTGRHQLELVNSALQYRATINVNVEPGRTASPTIPVPDGSLSVNALPWADVTIDGRAVGQTPLANLTLPIGPHDVVWRHPQLGERRQRVTVTAQTPARVGVNFAQ